MPLRVIEIEECLFEALLKGAPLRSLCFLVMACVLWSRCEPSGI
jgi:hypothetical protein